MAPAGLVAPARGFDDLTTSRPLPFERLGLCTWPTVQPAALIFFFATLSFVPTSFGTMHGGGGGGGGVTFSRV